MEGIHVALAPETVALFLGIPITNTLLTSWAVMLILIVIALVVGIRVRMVPSRFQTTLEWAFGYVYDYVTEVLESRDMARKFFPLLMTIFLFVFTSNVLEFTPGIGSIGFFERPAEIEQSHAPASGAESVTPQQETVEGVPEGMLTAEQVVDLEVEAARAHEAAQHTGFISLFRSVNTDLNVTLTLAIISFFVVEITGVAMLGIVKYASKFINFHSPIDFAVGIVELIGELARLISLSFRLFGNILAGEVLIIVAVFFVPYLGPVPLMLFELFIGFLQAAIFALLTLFFIKLAVTEAH